jgi:hypothetical protein
MTLTVAVEICQVAAQAALAVRGVAALQPDLGQRLASAASRTWHAAGIPAPPARAGIRVERAPDAPGWRLEVRCVLHKDRRVVDAARQVREQVQAAAVAHLTAHGTSEPVTVLVTVTRLVDPTPHAYPNRDRVQP